MSPLCDHCRSIPWSFFYNKTDDRERDIETTHTHHGTNSDLKRAAEGGCQFCDLILFWANDSAAKLDRDDQKALEESGPVVFHQDGPVFTPANDDTPTITFSVKIGPANVDLNYVRVPETVKSLSLEHTSADTNLVSSWVSNCLRNHEECRPVAASSFYPTRLVEIEGSHIRLVTKTALEERVDSPGVKYIALSYCWGDDMPVEAKSMTSSISQHQAGIEFDDLPRTFQDAIKVARTLGVSFIWIDSLCIIQDSEGDWQNEAAEMAEIYSNALLTLIAGSSASVTQGFRLHENLKAREKTFYYAREGSTSTSHQMIYIFPSVSMTGVSIDSAEATSKRGWTLQERELSKRKLTYSANGISWHCRRQRSRNDVPWGQTMPKVWMPLSVYNAELDNQQIRRLWREVVQEYSRRSLTKDSDRFPALAGIAQKLQERTDDKYVAGLWLSNAVSGLLWGSLEGGDHRRPTTWIAPTWSWGSVIGQVQLDFGLSNEAREKAIKILKMEAQLSGPDPRGAIKDASITISGKLKVAFTRGGEVEEYYERGPDGAWSRKKGRQLLEFSFGLCVGVIKYDVESEVQPGVVFCLRIAPFEANDWVPDMLRETAQKMGDVRTDMSVGLAIAPTGKAYGEFRRIGLVDRILDAWLDDVSESEVRVV